MRLYLSSFQLGNKPEELVKLAGDNKHVAVIVNAGDMATPEKRAQFVEEQMTAMRSIGLEPSEIDLRNYFGKSDALKNDLQPYGAIWLRGGNAFILKRAFEQSGFDKVILEMLERDQIVYAGYSAGIVVATKTLRGIELCDPKDAVPEGYKAEFNDNCLGLISDSIMPHYKSPHPETHLIDTVIDYMKENNLPYRTLHDGEAIVVNGTQEYVVG